MKKLLLVLIVFSFACGKDKTCWECTVRQMNGTNTTEKVCNDGEQPTFKDANGNDLNSICNKK